MSNYIEYAQHLHPYAKRIFADIDSGYQYKHYIFKGDADCACDVLARGLAVACGAWPEVTTKSIPCISSIELTHNPECVMDRLMAMPENMRAVFFECLPQDTNTVETVAEGLEGFTVFSRSQDCRNTFEHTLHVRPLARKELGEFIKHVHAERSAVSAKVAWKANKTLIDCVFDNTLGYQREVVNVMDKVARSWTAATAIANANRVDNIVASGLYECIIDTTKDISDVVSAVNKSMSECSCHVLGRFVMDKLIQDMLAGGSDFVITGKHALLKLDLTSTPGSFVFGCLEIARVLREG